MNLALNGIGVGCVFEKNGLGGGGVLGFLVILQWNCNCCLMWISEEMLRSIGFEPSGAIEGVPAGKMYVGRTDDSKEVIVSVSDAVRVFMREGVQLLPLGVMSFADLVATLKY